MSKINQFRSRILSLDVVFNMGKNICTYQIESELILYIYIFLDTYLLLLNKFQFPKWKVENLIYSPFLTTKSCLWTEVRGDFNIHGTKYSCTSGWRPKKPVLYMKYWPGFSVITSRVNISCREQVFLANERYRRLTT